ncbi:MAG: diguanylate cyclase [Candidatus Aminicenantes bacterium]|nr:diguanylate cyclase [Candidatus Aminicenantes bacterium]
MKAKALGRLFFYFALLSRAFAAGQSNLVFERLSIEQGLSQSAVNCILEDSRGFLWFGTKDGLDRYDGYRFKTFKFDPDDPGSLSDNFISCLTEDAQGNLWIGTQAGGLNIFNRATERFTAFDPGTQRTRSETAAEITAQVVDPSGKIWVGTSMGLFLLNSDDKSFASFPHDPLDPQSLSSDQVSALFLDREGRLWVATKGAGINLFDRQAGTFDRISFGLSDPDSSSLSVVNSILQDPDRILWMGTNQCLVRIDPETMSAKYFRGDAVKAVCLDRDGVIWLALLNKGLERFDPKTGRFIRFESQPGDPRSLSYDSLCSLFVDSSGILWIGTNGAGINKLNPQIRNFRIFTQIEADPASLHMKSLRAICEDIDGSFLIGGYSGLDRLDPKTQRFTRVLGQNSLYCAYCILPESGIPGIMLLGAEGDGLLAYDRARKTTSPFPPQNDISDVVYVLCKDRKGLIWAGTENGLYRLDPRTRDLVHFENRPSDKASLSHNVVRAIFEDRLGRIWVGTSGGGLNLFDENSRTFRHFTQNPGDTQSLSHNRLCSIMEDSKGRLWVGTQGGGLNLFHPETEKFTRYREKDGLPNDVVYGILEDGRGNLWLSTNKGLSRFNPEAGTFKNYDEDDGLPSNEFNGGSYFKNSSGELMFGGINGLVLFKPDEIRDVPFVPPVVITDFQIFNKSVPIGSGPDSKSPLPYSITETRDLTLSHRDRVFTFEFAALNYIFSEKNQYAYKMEGFENAWNYVGTRRYASYTNLSPGRYTFRVKGSNNDGIWNEKGASIRVRIIPPFWKTPWFYALCGIVVVLTALGAHNFRVRQLTRNKEELEKLVSLRTQELKETSLNDPLTGLRNRRFISEVLSSDLEAFISYKAYILENKAERRKIPDNIVFGVFMLDIDYFKDVNDVYGHDAGDQLLVHIAGLLKASVRADDVILRFGGDEFLIILKNTDSSYLQMFARRIKERITTADITVADQVIKTTCSIGYVQYPFYALWPKLFSFEKTVQVADWGLYHAKHNGRNMAVNLFPGANIPDEAYFGSLSRDLDDSLKNGYLSLNVIR